MLLLVEFRMELYWDGSLAPICITPADTLWKSAFFVGSISLFFAVPLVLLIVLYSVIARHLIVYPGVVASSHQHHAQTHPAPTHIKYRKQVVLMLGTVVVSFFVCLLPFRALTLWIIVAPAEAVGELSVDAYYILLFFCRIMLYINSAINPILYNLMSSKFRNGFMRLCRIKRCKTKLRRRSTFNTTTTTSTTCSSGNNRCSPNTSRKRSGQSSSGSDSLQTHTQRPMSPAKDSRRKSYTPDIGIGTGEGKKKCVRGCNLEGECGSSTGRGRRSCDRALYDLSESFV